MVGKEDLGEHTPISRTRARRELLTTGQGGGGVEWNVTAALCSGVDSPVHNCPLPNTSR